MLNKKGQIWVETVIYTLIGLVLIGIVLALLTPKINEIKDKSIVDQTIDAMKVFDSKISEIVEGGAGNVRNVEFGMKRGSLYVDGVNDLVMYEMEDSRVIYSEPSVASNVGRISVLTEEGSIGHRVTLTINYDFDLKVNGVDEEKKFTAAPVPYRFSVSHGGFSVGSETREIINIVELGQ